MRYDALYTLPLKKAFFPAALGQRWHLQIRDGLRGTAAEGFSLADVIALAPAYGILKLDGGNFAGGGDYNMKVGRVDADQADSSFPSELPAAGQRSEQLIDLFARKGFSVREFVALSGAHTVCYQPRHSLALHIMCDCSNLADCCTEFVQWWYICGSQYTEIMQLVRYVK